ncbi:hypothetical protein HOLleu_08404 [Holothuria leucospilota]|uniref:Uncharacterized protein n=1 Tax=Holothuria leucospilota TaxID=206669 RepID=A0A9Q1CIM1_HOLLE|nr:hypothetical protein HOLleu_08404 [Holothuria leucospilota]
MLSAFKILAGEAPVYLHDLITWYSPRSILQSENNNLSRKKSPHTIYHGNRNFITVDP